MCFESDDCTQNESYTVSQLPGLKVWPVFVFGLSTFELSHPLIFVFVFAIFLDGVLPNGQWSEAYDTS